MLAIILDVFTVTGTRQLPYYEGLLPVKRALPLAITYSVEDPSENVNKASVQTRPG